MLKINCKFIYKIYYQMTYKTIFFVVFCFLLQISNVFAQAPDYQKTFSAEYKDALKLLFDNKAIIKKMIPTEYQAEAIACVFPEMVRFSEVRNMIETSSLEMLYVSWGNRYADFSIGFFQMKPSFVESMENYVQQNNLSAQIYMPLISQNEIKPNEGEKEQIKNKRQNRIKNLRTWEGQLTYLKAFWQIVNIHFKNKTFASNTEKVHFFATAYNRGFLNTEQDIMEWQKKNFFPYGKVFKGKQYNYGTIAQEFYGKYALKLFK